MITWHGRWLKDGNTWRVAITTISEPEVGEEAVVINQHGDVTRVELTHLCRYYLLPHSDDLYEWVFAWKHPGDLRHTNNRTNTLIPLQTVITAWKLNHSE